MVVKRSEVWWASLPDPIGSATGYRRPVLSVQPDAFTRSRIRTIICAAITSNLLLAGASGNVRLSKSQSGLPKPSVINVSQAIALDRNSLVERVKAIDGRILREVDEGLRLVLTL